MITEQGKARSLYIAYFGVREPLVRTQVIPYLRELVKGGHEITLLTFEPTLIDEERIRAELKDDGIDWHWLRYHKRPSVPATLFDVANGARFIRKLMKRKPFDILHARSHVPMMMATAARRISPDKPKLLFDIRGFMPEEYVDAGVWPENGSIYRAVKRIEARLMTAADGFVVLTERAREILFPELSDTGRDSAGRPVEVIPCCVDLHRFEPANDDSRKELRGKLGIGNRLAVAYIGSFGGWYMAEETADFFGALKNKKSDAFAMILTQSEPSMIEPLLRKNGYSDGDFVIRRVSSEDIPRYLSAADSAVSFIKPCYSKQASSPTKNAEYLACGLPIAVNDGIGDTTELITADRTGVVVQEFTEAAYLQAVDELDKLMEDRESLGKTCRESARRRFDLETVGAVRYNRLYREVMK
jgi:glycosyltransferase involved in cell wall biosynthesis